LSIALEYAPIHDNKNIVVNDMNCTFDAIVVRNNCSRATVLEKLDRVVHTDHSIPEADHEHNDSLQDH